MPLVKGSAPSSASFLSQPAPGSSTIIPGSDFIVAEKPKPKAVVLVYGDGGTGKTTFGIRWAPEPAALIGFDGRSGYAELAATQLGRNIMSVQITPPSALVRSDDVRKVATEALQKVIRNFDAAVEASKTGKVRTIVLDTGTELGEIITLAVRGTLDNVKGDYGRSKDQINRIWWQIFGKIRAAENQAHLIVLARASAVWENNEPTGDFKARIHDVVRDAVDFAVHTRLSRGRISSGAVAGGGLVGGGLSGGGTALASGPSRRGPAKEFELQVTKAGNNISELGAVYTQHDWEGVGPFVYSCVQLMPGTAEDDWR